MKIAVETPTKFIQEFVRYTDYDFVEGSECLQDPEYYEQYKKIRSIYPQRELYLDNGAFLSTSGTPMDTNQYLDLADRLNATVTILPDVLGDKTATLLRVEKVIQRFLVRKKSGHLRVMGVLQGKSMKDYDSCLREYMRMGVDIFGIPYYAIDRELWLSDGLQSGVIPSIAAIHILGLRNPFDVLAFRRYSQVISVDSSLPIMSGRHGHRFRDGYFSSHKFHSSETLNPEHKKIVIDNIKLLRDMASNKVTQIRIKD